MVEIGVRGVLAFTGGEDSGYDFGNERACRRETGANDGDIAFNCRPSGCAWVVVCDLLASFAFDRSQDSKIGLTG